MSRTIDLMEAAGLIADSRGQLGTSSTYSLNKAAYSAVERLGVSRTSVTLRRGSAGLIRLRAGNRESSLTPFAPTLQTQEWEAALGDYNAFLAAHDISVPLSSDRAKFWVSRQSQDRLHGIPLVYPELFQISLYRQFNNGSFLQGGRLYGGWWIHCPKEIRAQICINKKPTIELDYSGCAIRMLYHMAGIDYKDDPYLINSVTNCELNNNLPAGYFRDNIKAIMQALINGNTAKNPERIFVNRSFYPYFTRAEIRKLIEQKHDPISSSFGTSKGIQLQNLESNIALRVIHSLIARGVLALPVHDSFLTSTDHGEVLRLEMIKQYHQSLGFIPLIK